MSVTLADIQAFKAQLAKAEADLASEEAAKNPPAKPTFALSRGNLSGTERVALETIIQELLARVEKLEGAQPVATTATTETPAEAG